LRIIVVPMMPMLITPTHWAILNPPNATLLSRLADQKY
jgi:hypothetical protein